MTPAIIPPQRTPRPTNYHPQLVISIHGIRTRGEWQKDFASVMSGSPTQTDAFDFGDYGLFRFVQPWVNRRKVAEFYKWYGQILERFRSVNQDDYYARPSVVAHSFGTWILGQAMLKYRDIKFDKVILAGCILPRNFDWCTLFARDQVAEVLNECGRRDPWPQWASRLVIGTGTAGSKGFDWFSCAVENRQNSEGEHGDSLSRSHMQREWVPFLRRFPSPLAIRSGSDIRDSQLYSDCLDHSGTVIDEQVYGALPNYDQVEIPRGLALAWIRVNPDIYTFLIHRESGKPAGYLNAMPLEDSAYAKVRAGQLKDNEVTDAYIVPYQADFPLIKIYFMSIAIDPTHRRCEDGVLQQAYVKLITGFLSKLVHYAENHGIFVTHFLATAWTQEGRRICQQLRMTEVGKDSFGDPIFEVDLRALAANMPKKLMPAMRHLLQVYSNIAADRPDLWNPGNAHSQ